MFFSKFFSAMGTGTAIAVRHHLRRTGGTEAMPAGGKTHKFMSVVIVLKIILNPHAVGRDHMVPECRQSRPEVFSFNFYFSLITI